MNKKITELAISQLVDILELKAYNAVLPLPISDNIISNSFFDLKNFNYKNKNIELESLDSKISNASK